MKKELIRESVIEWCENKNNKGIILFDIENSRQTRVRFMTKNMNSFFPLVKNVMVPQESVWTGHCYFYEIELKNDGVRIKLALNNVEQKPILNRMNLLFDFNKKHPEKEDWIWYICWGTKIVHSDDIKDKNELFEILDFQYSLIMKSEKDFMNYIFSK